MTKEDYELIADTLSRSDRTNWRSYMYLCEDFANAFTKRDPNFERQEFMDWCVNGVEEV